MSPKSGSRDSAGDTNGERIKSLKCVEAGRYVSAARSFAALPGASVIFGHLAGTELLHDGRPHWHGPAEVGVIAGSHSLGFGRFLGHLPEPNDGTVAVEEATLDGASDLLVLPVSHTGLLASEDVVAATVRFLNSGRFAAPGP